jgi:transcription initiation factor TFIID subunit 5
MTSSSAPRQAAQQQQQQQEDEDDDMDVDEAPPEPVSHLFGHTGAVTGVCFSHDDALLFSASSDCTVRLWSTELAHNLVVFKGHVHPVWSVDACPLGYYFASGGADRAARVWCTERAAVLRVMAGHQGDVDVVKWHPNCQYLATGSGDRSVRLWDVGSGK